MIDVLKFSKTVVPYVKLTPKSQLCNQIQTDKHYVDR